MLRIGKVSVKVGLEQSSSTGLMLQDLAHLALWVWVQDKSRPRHGQISKGSLFLLRHGVKSTLPYHMSTKQDTNPCSNKGWATALPIEDGKGSSNSTMVSPCAVALSACTYSAPSSTSIGSAPKGDKGGPSSASSSTGPHCTR